jgi:hypothetical protein
MEFQEACGVFEVALLRFAALGLDFAELVDGLLELAGESRVVQAEGGKPGIRDWGLGFGKTARQRLGQLLVACCWLLVGGTWGAALRSGWHNQNLQV